MRILIASAAAMTMAAAAAAAMALHAPPARPLQRAPAAANPAQMPSDAVPGLVWRSGSATLRLTDRPCASEEFTRALETEGVTKARAYDVVQGSRRYSGCWSKDIGGDVVTMEPGRDIGQIPLDWFRRES
ncbi:hypothetical protein HHL11_12435 [Ramlibacter sp. G-1-2-2]|uniref:Uncharacterized protein n=1 Tax=Ramlibacter agri TaxID=2728837 RepID=A0A848H188_9BURK|nr:hypothetical protein [Ramlibacter agri]NML44565.1 hypothetical protein [Ramlibacter agri]